MGFARPARSDSGMRWQEWMIGTRLRSFASSSSCAGGVQIFSRYLHSHGRQIRVLQRHFDQQTFLRLLESNVRRAA